MGTEDNKDDVWNKVYRNNPRELREGLLNMAMSKFIMRKERD